MNNKTKSLIFDIFQISSLLFFLFTGPVIASSSIFVLFQTVAIIILFVAAWQMRRTKYYRVPDVGKQNELVTDGIYAYVRNPMYLSQLLFCGALLLDVFSIPRLLVYLIYITNFILKIRYEELLLDTHFKEFAGYKKTSWRLFPFVY
ncbi:hypothetical protein COU88_05245 [Candidatus Roizmanbacteria bacterium CG10_big_fil_rev_8_21_14_0_10_39_6]|uniref:Isoprenylcysteine carboxylmethyltransferase family protein n=1 Tax=Candidatus Roizmanbacteria bacterium CG10_big_fil_rev_8_21_14_0_10_39_6 TaxID=1974853 RepID=A0A2M8KR43_9BACT|nr:MAG: hypothetical protein COU88_05245 [Candidatus Roizmanbacteria bacterium CG10_big_fil_rev_8_21_14_0_10_39_6]